MARHGVLFALLLLAVAVAGAEPERAPEEAAQLQVLPRPLVIELPTEERCRDGADEEGAAELRCASWRMAGEANNLAPWTALPEECAPHVRRYLTGPAYRSDLELVAREASAFARAAATATAARAVAPDAAWVFDVDETLLSNLPYYAQHGYGLELFDHLEFDKWVERGEAPAIPSSLSLYNEVRELGFKTFLLTGRSEGHEGVTVDNLRKEGFHEWDKLILRAPADRKKTATDYKSEKRKEMEAEGYKILGNSGDQWSDLLGYSMSARSFKLPNPMYYIP
ncbi:acid phosphatase 1-like [Lolium rigidum]|uniref:acid phosphatase 1-like n=1 Tax=Lolium rigidum TaxID=89674 RepID=UPI001F5C4647|nr:acid phosphatase 1-like [Lolium rigidum]